MELNKIHEYVSRFMIGRIGMLAEESLLLAQTVSKSARHLEIGTLWGGSAMVAAFAGAKQVYSIDLMSGGWWDAGQDPHVNPPLGPKAVIDNLTGAHLRNRVVLIIAPSDPFPLPGYTFDTALIDGDHARAGVQADWRNVHPVTKDYILFHDADAAHPGVSEFLQSGEIEKDGWHMVEQAASLKVYAPKKESAPDEKTVSDRDHADDTDAQSVSSGKPRQPRRAKRS